MPIVQITELNGEARTFTSKRVSAKDADFLFVMAMKAINELQNDMKELK